MVSIESKSVKKSILSKCLISALQVELGNDYKPGADIENLLQFASLYGKMPVFASLSPKPHATGMRLISILTLDTVIMTGILESAVGAFNSIFTKED